MAGEAADAGVGRVSAEQLLAALRARRERHGPWSVEESHEERKPQPVRQVVIRVEKALIADVVAVRARDVVWFALVEVAIDVFLGRLRKHVVCHAHLDVVGFAGENRDRLVLRLPAESRDRAVIPAAIGNARDAELRAYCSRRRMTTEDLAVLNAVNDAQPVKLQRNPKS